MLPNWSGTSTETQNSRTCFTSTRAVSDVGAGGGRRSLNVVVTGADGSLSIRGGPGDATAVTRYVYVPYGGTSLNDGPFTGAVLTGGASSFGASFAPAR